MNKRTRIVIVDDHNLVREGLCGVIEGIADFEVIGTAASADEGMPIIRDRPPDVVLMDIAMPGRCPFAITRELIQYHPELSIVFVTGFISELIVQRALDSGARGLVYKGVDPQGLETCIRAVQRGERFLSQEIFETFNIQINDPEFAMRTEHLDRLTRRELEVINYVATGMTAREMSEMMKISVKTVNRHRNNVMEKLNIHSNVELTRYAIREGITVLGATPDLLGGDQPHGSSERD